jgi:DNA damage-inducible protein 1
MLAIGVQNPAQQRRPLPSSSTIPPAPDAARIEALRRQISSDPEQMAALRAKNPALAAAVADPPRFLAAWMESVDKLDREKAEREKEIRLLNQDPFNSDAQKKIQDMIRREKIQENLQYALENNPAGTSIPLLLYQI